MPVGAEAPILACPLSSARTQYDSDHGFSLELRCSITFMDHAAPTGIRITAEWWNHSGSLTSLSFTHPRLPKHDGDDVVTAALISQ